MNNDCAAPGYRGITETPNPLMNQLVSDTEPKPRPVAGALMDLSSGISVLGSIVDEIEERISPVMRPTGPQPMAQGQNEAVPVPIACDLANMLQYEREKVRQLAARLSSYIDRLDI